MPNDQIQEELARRRARPRLPEKIELANLGALNQALAALFDKLPYGRSVPLEETQARPGAVIALAAVWDFLLQFPAAREKGLHVPDDILEALRAGLPPGLSRHEA